MAIIQSKHRFSRTAALAQQAGQLLEERALRGQYLPATLFGEFGWDILLMLFQAGPRECRCAKDLSERLDCSTSVATRWLDYLEGKGLCESRGRLRDADLQMVELTEDGRACVTDYLNALEALRR